MAEVVVALMEGGGGEGRDCSDPIPALYQVSQLSVDQQLLLPASPFHRGRPCSEPVSVICQISRPCLPPPPPPPPPPQGGGTVPTQCRGYCCGGRTSLTPPQPQGYCHPMLDFANQLGWHPWSRQFARSRLDISRLVVNVYTQKLLLIN